MKLTINGAMLAAVALAGGGCVMEDGSSDEAISEAHQSVSSLGYWSWGCTSNCSLDLGKETDPVTGQSQTCFLAGVWGNLQPAGIYSEVIVTTLPDGHWVLQIVTDGRPLGGTAVCIPGKKVSTGTWYTGLSEVNLGWGSTRRCFLSGILNTNGFTEFGDYAQVHQIRGGTWFLGSNMATKETQVSAVCVDVPSAAPDWGLVITDGGTILNSPMQYNNPWGWACGIKKLGGHFTTSDWNDGVWIDYNNGISTWEINGVNGKQATADCVK